VPPGNGPNSPIRRFVVTIRDPRRSWISSRRHESLWGSLPAATPTRRVALPPGIRSSSRSVTASPAVASGDVPIVAAHPDSQTPTRPASRGGQPSAPWALDDVLWSRGAPPGPSYVGRFLVRLPLFSPSEMIFPAGGEHGADVGRRLAREARRIGPRDPAASPLLAELAVAAPMRALPSAVRRSRRSRHEDGRSRPLGEEPEILPRVLPGYRCEPRRR
jgi:hypothetical protein